MKNLLFFLIIASFQLACTKESEPTIGGREEKEPDVIEELDPQLVFPQGISFKDCIKPDHKSQEQLNKDVEAYYTYWRKKYVKASNGNTPGGGYYVNMKGTGGDGSEITTSEAHGYGMIIFALMAGHEAKAKAYFDGMYNMFDKHRSTGNPYCMSWVIHNTESTSYDQGSASDGDLDIAYALLLADQQWSSDGKMKYMDYAKEMIEKGLKKSIIHSQSKRVMMGDWDNSPYSTRSSDWMTAHFHSFQKVTGDALWTQAASTVYELIGSITKNYTSENGLMPDFVVGQTPKPAPENYLGEFKETDEYCWNACRYPWRITMDFAHFNTNEAKEAMLKINAFIRAETSDNPSLIKAGYHLDGTPLVDYTSAAFSGPLITSSIVNPEAQEFLNDGWEVLKDYRGDYYGDTLCLLNMLLISGNWWNPVAN